MSEFTLPAQLQPISATATNFTANTTQTEPSSPGEKCELTRDALRGVMVDLKKMLKVLEERQNAHHRCMTGRNLRDTQPGETGYRSAVNLMGGAAMVTMGLDQIAFATGINLDGN